MALLHILNKYIMLLNKYIMKHMALNASWKCPWLLSFKRLYIISGYLFLCNISTKNLPLGVLETELKVEKEQDPARERKQAECKQNCKSPYTGKSYFATQIKHVW